VAVRLSLDDRPAGAALPPEGVSRLVSATWMQNGLRLATATRPVTRRRGQRGRTAC
jgi:hypothetical protein